MKKLSKRHRKLLIYKAVKGLRFRRISRRKSAKLSSYVTLWDGESEERALCLNPPTIPPKNIDFEENIKETLSFLKIIRDRLGKKKVTPRHRLTWIKKRKNKTPIINSYYDFSAIERLDIAPALVVAASYDRAKRMTGTVPPAVNYTQWSQSALQTFYEIGFFDLIGQKHHEKLKKEYEHKVDSNIRICRAISGRNADNLNVCSDSMSDILKFLTEDETIVEEYIPDINTAVSEAMINVSRHAYPQEYVTKSIYDTVNQWWVTARADKIKHTLNIVIYDQGASIPGTLPYRGWFKDMIDSYFNIFFPEFKYSSDHRLMDHEYINYSMKPGRTQTENPERGLGLPQMQSLTNLCEDGYIMVISRAGFYRYDKGTGITKHALPIELEGTLVEWHLSLPRRKAQ